MKILVTGFEPFGSHHSNPSWDAVEALGLAGGEDKVSVERVGINLMEARIPDNDGFQPFDTPICPDGDTAYFSTLPVKRMAKAVESRGIACCMSYSAGTFVCNAALYTGLYLSSCRYRFMKSIRCGS